MLTNNKVFLSPEQAIEMMADGKEVHTFRNPNGILIGADWPRDTLIEKFRREDNIELSGDLATKMNHGICVWDTDGPLFVATKEAS